MIRVLCKDNCQIYYAPDPSKRVTCESMTSLDERAPMSLSLSSKLKPAFNTSVRKSALPCAMQYFQQWQRSSCFRILRFLDLSGHER